MKLIPLCLISFSVQPCRVEPDIPIYLYMDNAGGHGKKHVVEKYVATLKDDYNVIIRHQRPRSPATNMLDLGVWMALQNVVEKLHFRLQAAH